MIAKWSETPASSKTRASFASPVSSRRAAAPAQSWYPSPPRGSALAKVVSVSRPGAGFEDEAVRHARTRRYRPATKGNVPVRVWLPLVVTFRNPKG